jgi:hypothetical protein
LGSISHLGPESHTGPGSEFVEDVSSLSCAVLPLEDFVSFIAVKPGQVFSVLDFNFDRRQLGVDEWACGWSTSSGSFKVLALPNDKRFDFGPSARMSSEGSLFACGLQTSCSPPDIMPVDIIESMLDKLEARCKHSSLDLRITAS